jgi:hypothetical protein
VKKIDLEEMQRELDEKGKSGFRKDRENRHGYCGMLPWHAVSWATRPKEGGIEIMIQMVHPDGVDRGIILVVPNSFLVATSPGNHFLTKILRRDEEYPGEFEEQGIKQCPCCHGYGHVQIVGEVDVEEKTDE